MSISVTPKSKDYSKWYTDGITKAELADYGPVKGTMVIRPYGFSVWDSIKDAFDKRFKETRHVNAQVKTERDPGNGGGPVCQANSLG